MCLLTPDVNVCEHVFRLWDYNHTEFFPERVLTTFDGFPIRVCNSSNPWVARLLRYAVCLVCSMLSGMHDASVCSMLQYAVQWNINLIFCCIFRSGKYKTWVVKCDLGIALCGFPVNYTGPHIGVRNDARMWKDNPRRRATMYPWVCYPVPHLLLP